jgi:predicted NUDIX family phosphoesterase/dephospho-CoA kinase
MTAKELVDMAFEEKIFSDKIYGFTPYKTMNARLSEEIVKHGNESKFVRTAPGVFFLRQLLHPQNVQAEDNLLIQGPTSVRMYEAKRRLPSQPEERVLVIPREIISSKIKHQGIKTVTSNKLTELISNSTTKYINRIEAENTDQYKQIVVYVIIKQRDQILSFRRGIFSRAAAFLRGSLCIGFGGHVSQDDYSIFSQNDMGLTASIFRELAEEIGLRNTPGTTESLKFKAIINDDSSPDGRRHLGIVYEYEAPKNFKPQKGEASINQLNWIDLKEGRVDLNQFEYWSQLCLREFYTDFVRAQPDFKIVRRKPFSESQTLVITGPIGSGKSAAAKQIATALGYQIINSGVALARLLNIPPVPHTPRGVFQVAAWNFITSNDGPKKLAEEIFNEIADTKQHGFVIDGIRQRSTLTQLRDLIKPQKVAVIYIHAAPDMALNFYKMREAKNLPLEDTFKQLYSAKVEEEVRYMISDADAIIYNWLGRTDYKKVVRQLIGALGGAIK